MIYICSASWPALLNYVQLTHPGEAELHYFGLNLHQKIDSKRLQGLVSLGDPSFTPIQVIRYQAPLLNLVTWSLFNTTYIHVPQITVEIQEQVNKQESMAYLQLKVSQYHQGLNALKDFVSGDAHQYLWEKWLDDPRKANLESWALALQAKTKKKPLRLADLYSQFESTNISNTNLFSLTKYLGTTLGNSLVSKLSGSDLHVLFIGSDTKKPLLKSLIKNQNKQDFIFYTFDIIKADILLNKISLKTAVLLWHFWLVETVEILGLTNDFKAENINQQNYYQQLTILKEKFK